MTAAGDEHTESGATLAPQPRTRARFARATLVVAGLLTVGFGASRVVRWRQRKAFVLRVSEALGSYAECMLGAPLEPGETATSRLRRIEAGLPEVSDVAALPAAEPWPQRCRADLEQAHAVLTASREAPAARLDALVASAIKDPSPADAPGLVDDLLQAAALAGASAIPRRYPPSSRSRHVAPPPASPLTASQLTALPVPVHASPDELPGVDPLTLQLTFQDSKGAPWSCAWSPLHGEPLREVRCGELRRGAVAVLREDAAHGPGYLRTTRDRFDRFELVRQLPDGSHFIDALTGSMETVALYGDALVWVTAHRWYARTVPPGRAPLGVPVDLGEVSGIAPELEVCPTRNALLVGVKTYESLGVRSSWRVMAAREGGEWQRTPGRAVVDVGATLTCEGHAGTWTWFEDHVVTEVRCNADRCETHASDRLSLSWDVGGPLFAADLGGRALLLGLGTTPGPLTGTSVASVRMRMAPLAAITRASDEVLFSDQAHEGAPVSNVNVYVRDGVAVVLLLLQTDDPLPFRAFRVDALGEFAPIIVAD